MRLFLDAASVDERRAAAKLGVISDVTTNASLRHPRHVIEAARAGAHISTIPYAVLQGMLRHPLTDVGIERFLADAQKAMKTERV